MVPDGFAGAALKTTTEKVVAGRHRRGPADQRPGPRGDSDAHGLGGALDGPFSCWRIFVKDSTESLFVGCFNNVLCLLPVLRVFGFGRFPERAPGPVHRPQEARCSPPACMHDH